MNNRKKKAGYYKNLIRDSGFRSLDAAAAVICLSVIFIFAAAVYSSDGDSLNVYIETIDGLLVYPIDDDILINIDGPEGISRVEIVDGKVSFLSSPCRDKLCIISGVLSKSGQWTACLPNRIIIRIKGADDEEIDALSY